MIFLPLVPMYTIHCSIFHDITFMHALFLQEKEPDDNSASPKMLKLDTGANWLGATSFDVFPAPDMVSYITAILVLNIFYS